MRCGLCCTNDFFAERSKLRIAGDDAQLEVSILCPSRDPQAPRTIWFASNSNPSRLTMPITWAASFCCVSFSERGHRLRVETPGEKSHVRRESASESESRKIPYC
jgi:hypothetical protein